MTSMSRCVIVSLPLQSLDRAKFTKRGPLVFKEVYGEDQSGYVILVPEEGVENLKQSVDKIRAEGLEVCAALHNGGSITAVQIKAQWPQAVCKSFSHESTNPIWSSLQVFATHADQTSFDALFATLDIDWITEAKLEVLHRYASPGEREALVAATPSEVFPGNAKLIDALGSVLEKVVSPPDVTVQIAIRTLSNAYDAPLALDLRTAFFPD